MSLGTVRLYTWIDVEDVLLGHQRSGTWQAGQHGLARGHVVGVGHCRAVRLQRADSSARRGSPAPPSGKAVDG